MAIEKNIIPPKVEELNPGKNTTPEEQEVGELIEVMTEETPMGVTMTEDGGAILGDIEEEIETTFDENLAEVLPEDELMRIASDLVGGVEKDKSSREDWEKTIQTV